jgi:hypothetical protein
MVCQHRWQYIVLSHAPFKAVTPSSLHSHTYTACKLPFWFRLLPKMWQKLIPVKGSNIERASKWSYIAIANCRKKNSLTSKDIVLALSRRQRQIRRNRGAFCNWVTNALKRKGASKRSLCVHMNVATAISIVTNALLSDTARKASIKWGPTCHSSNLKKHKNCIFNASKCGTYDIYIFDYV